METSQAQNVVEIQLDLTPQDFTRFAWWHTLHSTATRVVLVVMVLLLFCFACLALYPTRPQDRTDAVIVIGMMLAVWLVVVPLSIRLSARRQFATHRAAQEQCSFVAGEGGVASASSLGSGQQRWEVFWRAVEAKSAFYLYVSNKMAYVLPKRCFTSDEQMQRFRDLVRAGMGGKARGL